MLNRYGPWMDTNLLFPLSHNTCEVVFDYFLEEDFIEARGLEGGREEEGGREGGARTILPSSIVNSLLTVLGEEWREGWREGGRKGGREGGREGGVGRVIRRGVHKESF